MTVGQSRRRRTNSPGGVRAACLEVRVLAANGRPLDEAAWQTRAARLRRPLWAVAGFDEIHNPEDTVLLRYGGDFPKGAVLWWVGEYVQR